MDAALSQPDVDGGAVAVSIVIPCLNEVRSLGACIATARQALVILADRMGLAGEIVVADNGSTDSSQALAAQLGARVVEVREKGYGAALHGGFDAADGAYLVMGDADGSYDFRESVAMIEALRAGADLCMGSRFLGEIKPGAMPWANRHVGNPVLTGLLNILYGMKVSDAHCGLRALTKACWNRLALSGEGMEFASEMVIKAALRGETIAEVPVTLWPDTRDRKPHLRPWRDGWRHLRYLLMLSPLWLFAIPAATGATAGAAILAIAGWFSVFRPNDESFFGNYWVVLAGATIGVSHIAALLGMVSHVHGVKAGYRRPHRVTGAVAGWITLETMLLLGAGLALGGGAVLIAVVFDWSSRNFGPTYSVLPIVLGTLLITLGAQTVLGGFILAIIGGNDAKFLAGAARDREI
jgi:glycosyltransferase involved in cell wall biosynthesis